MDEFIHKILERNTTQIMMPWIEFLEKSIYQYNPRTLIYQRSQTKIYHYQSPQKSTIFPLLIVFATINKPEILDLFPERSFIRNLLAQGLDIYLIDWGCPDIQKPNQDFAHYVNELHHAIQFVNEMVQKKVNVLAICQGGLISLCYTALYPTIEKLILISTPIDFHTNHVTDQLLKHINVKELRSMQALVPGQWLRYFFMSLNPFGQLQRKYLSWLKNQHNPQWVAEFLRIEKWLQDVPDQSALALADLIKYFYQENQLITGSLSIANQHVDLKNITIPILNITASRDEIVPAKSSLALRRYIGSPSYKESKIAASHIGLYLKDKNITHLCHSISSWLKKSP